MLLIPEKNAVLVRPRQPEKLLKLIPTAKAVRYKGRDVVAVPHRMEEVRVLNNIGVKAPSPILTKYSWPREESIIPYPFEAQRHTAAFLTLNPRGFVLNDMGTGKSMATLWAWDYLYSQKLAGRLLVIGPLSTLERTWADEVFYHLPHRTAVVVYGSRQKREKLLKQEADIYIVNHHGTQVIADSLRFRPDITHVALDEISEVARNKRTDMWEAHNEIVNGNKTSKIIRSVWGLTATPTPNEPTDAWAQIRLVNPSRVTPYYTRFRDTVMRQAGPYTWVPRPNATDIVDEALQPAVRFRIDACLDLPPVIYMMREVELEPAQKKAYKSMLDDLVAQMETGQILAVNEAVKIGKLVQIACGVVYDTDNKEQIIGAEKRIAATIELINQSESSTIVFAPYVSAVNMVAAALEKEGFDVRKIYGEVSKSKRDEAFHWFQQPTGRRVIVAQPEAMSHGLTLTRASTIVWYAPVTKAGVFTQANGRITRSGQKYTQVIACIEGTPTERHMYARLKAKQSMQNLLLDRKVFRDVA